MAPKFCPDQDGHIAPCSIINDWKSLEKWEDFKTFDLKLRGKERKVACYCRFFEGKVPESHICFIPKKPSFLQKILLKFNFLKCV